jgi:hypothetical protein
MARLLIGACGMLCFNCAVFIATASADMKKRTQLAKELSVELGKKVKPSAVACWGCRSADRSCLHPDCRYRVCARDKGIEYCYRCAKFPCPELQAFYQNKPDAQENLRKICKMGIEAFIAEMSK